MDTPGNNQKPTTSQLLDELFKADSPYKYFQDHEDEAEPQPLHMYLKSLCSKSGKLPSEIIKKANIETSYGYQIFKGKRNPSRDTVIALAFGFEMDVEQTQNLLKRAGMAPLYPRIKKDAAIIYCLSHHMSLYDTQCVIMELKLPMIGEKKNG